MGMGKYQAPNCTKHDKHEKNLGKRAKNGSAFLVFCPRLFVYNATFFLRNLQ